MNLYIVNMITPLQKQRSKFKKVKFFKFNIRITRSFESEQKLQRIMRHQKWEYPFFNGHFHSYSVAFDQLEVSKSQLDPEFFKISSSADFFLLSKKIQARAIEGIHWFTYDHPWNAFGSKQRILRSRFRMGRRIFFLYDFGRNIDNFKKSIGEASMSPFIYFDDRVKELPKNREENRLFFH